MIHNEGKIQGAQNLELFYQSWCPDTLPRAALIVIHGFGEHSGRYPHLVRSLTEHGIAVYIFDQRGHGRSPGQRGHINNWNEYREDVRLFVQWVKEQEHDQPIFLLGHSMGAVTTLDYTLFYPSKLTGLIISGGPFEPTGVGSPFLIALANFLSRFFPSFPLPLYIDPKALSRDPSVGEAYQNDPLVHGKASARWGTEVLEALERVIERLEEIQIPILLIHGELDRLNTADGSRKYFEALTCPDKMLCIYPDSYHELHNEINHAQVLEDLAEWILQHLGEHGL
jgi:alpha-beta hydrolase superfamily lysophospholipase